MRIRLYELLNVAKSELKAKVYQDREKVLDDYVFNIVKNRKETPYDYCKVIDFYVANNFLCIKIEGEDER